MAPQNPSLALQSRADHSAQLFRMALAGLVPGAMTQGATSPSGGVHPYFGNRLAVTGQASMNVSVDTGLVYMPGSTAWQGVYSGFNSAVYTVAVPASNATQWRSDYIVARQHDTTYGDPDSNWDIIDVPGAFSGSAPGSLPALPNNAVILAIIRVVPNMTVTNGAGTVVDQRQYIHLPVPQWTTSGFRPPLTVPDGHIWVETDTHQIGIVLNGAYNFLHLLPQTGQPYDAWHALPTMQNSWTNPNGVLNGSSYRLRPSDPTVMEIMMSLQSPATPPDGQVVMTMPAGWRVTNNYQYAHAAAGAAASYPPYFRFDTTGNVTCFGMAALAVNTPVIANATVRIT